MSVTGSILAGVGLAGSIGGAAIGATGAQNAASTQAQAAQQAAQLQYQSSQNALDFQKGEYGQSQANLAPWLQSGEGGLANLDYLLGVKPPTTQGASSGSPGAFTGAGATGVPPPGSTSAYGTPVGGGASGPTGTTNLSSLVNPSIGTEGSLLSGYGSQFQAPTAQQALEAPGEQAQLRLGEQALQQSAAARGSLLTGGTAQGLNAYAQDLASTNYQNTYNQAYNTYSSNYNQFQQQQANQYNRLAALSGTGQVAAQNLGTLGQGAASGISSNILGSASNIGQQLNNAGAANASGIVGASNAYSGALSGIGGNLTNLALINQLYGTGGKTPITGGGLSGWQPGSGEY